MHDVSEDGLDGVGGRLTEDRAGGGEDGHFVDDLKLEGGFFPAAGLDCCVGVDPLLDKGLGVPGFQRGGGRGGGGGGGGGQAHELEEDAVRCLFQENSVRVQVDLEHPGIGFVNGRGAGEGRGGGGGGGECPEPFLERVEEVGLLIQVASGEDAVFQELAQAQGILLVVVVVEGDGGEPVQHPVELDGAQGHALLGQLLHLGGHGWRRGLRGKDDHEETRGAASA